MLSSTTRMEIRREEYTTRTAGGSVLTYLYDQSFHILVHITIFVGGEPYISTYRGKQC